MGKRLTLIRHAKSSWANSNQPDYARDLNERGQRDALRMGDTLYERKIKFDLLLCSSALRAKETLSRLNEKLNLENESIQYLDDLYCASVPTLLELVQQADNDKNNIAIVAHNPGLEDLASQLTDSSKVFPTCSVMQIQFKFNDWHQIDRARGIETLFLSPKTL